MADKDTNVPNKNDFISREAAIQAIEDIDENAGARGSGFTDPERIMRDSAFCALEAIQPADVRPVVRGKWVRGNENRTSPIKDIYICSVCGEKTLSGFCGNPAKTNFCPNCGADMREPNLDTTKGDNHD